MKLRPALVRATPIVALSVLLLSEKQLAGPLAPPLSDDDVSSLVTGEFSGNTHVDAVVLANGKPVLRESIETYQTYIQADVPSADIARLRGTGTGGRDQLISVGSGGLTRLEYAAPSWNITNLRSASTLWSGGHTLRIGQVDGINGDDIVAVTGNKVLIARSDGYGGWMSDVSFLAGTGITGVELVDWDGAAGGALEIAVLIGRTALGPAKIRLMRADGTGVTLITTSADSVIAAPLASQANGPRWLAAVATTSTGAQELAVLSSTTLSGPWSLGEITGVRDIVTGDWGDDGLDDVILNTNTSAKAFLYRTVLGSAMDVTLSLLTPIGNPTELPVGHPQRNVTVQDGRMDVADVDHDGDLDLVSAVQGVYQISSTWHYLDLRFTSVEVTANDFIPQENWMPWHCAHDPWPVELPLPEFSPTTGNLTVSLLTPHTVIPDAKLEYAVYRTPTIDSYAISTPICGPGTLDMGLESTNGVSWSTLTIPTNLHDSFFPDRLTLVTRQTVRVNGAITKEGPALKMTFFSPLDAAEFSIHYSDVATDPVVNSEHQPNDTGGTNPAPGVPSTPAGQQPTP